MKHPSLMEEAIAMAEQIFIARDPRAHEIRLTRDELATLLAAAMGHGQLRAARDVMGAEEDRP